MQNHHTVAIVRRSRPNLRCQAGPRAPLAAPRARLVKGITSARVRAVALPGAPTLALPPAVRSAKPSSREPPRSPLAAPRASGEPVGKFSALAGVKAPDRVEGRLCGEARRAKGGQRRAREWAGARGMRVCAALQTPCSMLHSPGCHTLRQSEAGLLGGADCASHGLGLLFAGELGTVR